MKQFSLNLFFVSGILFGLSLAGAVENGEDKVQEEIFTVEEINEHPFARQFINIQANLMFDGKNMDFNPFRYFKNNVDYHPILSGQNKPVQSIYVAKRIVNTKIPLEIFERPELTQAAVQAKLFKSVTFENCGADYCSAKQLTALGRAKYKVAYRFLKANELGNISAPLSQEEAVGVKYALIQNAYNWNDFFTTGFNMILIREVNKHAQLISFQVFFLGKHALPDWAYEAKISSDLQAQADSFVEVLSQP